MRTAILSTALLLIIPAIGCEKSVDLTDASPVATRTTGKVKAKPTSAAPTITPAEVDQFAAKLSEAVSAKDMAAFTRLVDLPAMADRAVAGLGLPPSQEQAYAQGLVQGLKQHGNFMQQLNPDGQATYDLTKTLDQDGETVARFRLVSVQGVNFHDFTLTKRDGTVRATNLMIFLSGETLSDTWRRTLLPVIKEQNKNWLQKLATSESEFVQALPQFEKFSQQVAGGDATGALETYAQMPKSMQQDPMVMLLRYRAASDVSEEAVIAAAEAFREAHPDSGSIDLLMVDVHFLKGNFDEAVACLDRVQQVVGRDSYLSFLAGNAWHQKGDIAAAMERLTTATTLEPTVQDAFWLLAAIAMEQQNFQLTADTLTKVEQQFEVEWNNLRELPEYADFAASEEGQAWMAERGI